DETPPPAARGNPTLPTELERIIGKALEKDRAVRYQSAAEIRTDLQQLKRETESGRAAVGTAGKSWGAARKWPSLRWIAGTGMLIIALTLGGWVYSAHGGRALTDKDTIVLADFTNTTSDMVFDDALKQGLAVQLEQSPFLNVLADQKVQ